ncbi:MAG TPA: hypothetical protein VJV78_34610 [Polyangiales bacterium]|nr:hypothetical protein [Polyangiales bacterium]
MRRLRSAIDTACVCLLLTAAGCAVVSEPVQGGQEVEDASVDAAAAAEASTSSGEGEAGAAGAGGTSGAAADAGAAGAAGAMPPDDSDSGTSPGSCAMPVCTAGQQQVEQQSCGLCGYGVQNHRRTCAADGCSWSAWSEWTACAESAEVECTPGAEEQLPSMPCGERCGHAGVKRVCTTACAWSDPMKGACEGEGVCTPGAKADLPAVSCNAMCGHASQSHTCTNACSWGPTVSGACTGTGACTPGQTRTVATGNACGPCSKGDEQQTQTCSASCAWAATATSCALPGNVCKPEGYEGSTGWHCVGNGQREWCYVATESPEFRCTWTGGREPYSGCP